MEEDNGFDRATSQKRAREVPLSPSPASVMHTEMMVVSPSTERSISINHHTLSFESPSAKRQRRDVPRNAVANGSCTHAFLTATAATTSTSTETNPVVFHDVSPQADRMPNTTTMMAASNTVTMERDDQYEWWKAPPAAPQLLPASTMGLSSLNNAANDPSSTTTTKTTTRMMGCNACQRLFIPPTISNAPIQQNTLLNYFTSNKPKPATTATTSPSMVVDKAACLCTFCERSTCAKCLRSCEQCQHAFCTLCSTQTYVTNANNNREEEQTLCLDCASMLDLSQAAAGTASTNTMDMMEG